MVRNNKKYLTYWIFAVTLALLMTLYPIYMGVKVIALTVKNGSVPIEQYPKYVIPYAPIALALVSGVLLMPVFQRLSKKLDLLFVSVFAIAVFLTAELLMETKILVTGKEIDTTLQSWQLGLCYIPPDMYKTRVWEAVDVLLGGYKPTFKLHFYAISFAMLLSLLNSFYGFGNMLLTGDKKRKKALVIQTAAALFFTGLCIWACFTAFYREGELTILAVSAWLMAIFFVSFGVTVGVFAGSLTLGKRKLISIGLPALTALLTAILMYVGELLLLNGHLYIFGSGFFFESLPLIVLSPADILVVLASGGITALIFALLNGKKAKAE